MDSANPIEQQCSHSINGLISDSLWPLRNCSDVRRLITEFGLIRSLGLESDYSATIKTAVLPRASNDTLIRFFWVVGRTKPVERWRGWALFARHRHKGNFVIVSAFTSLNFHPREHLTINTHFTNEIKRAIRGSSFTKREFPVCATAAVLDSALYVFAHFRCE